MLAADFVHSFSRIGRKRAIPVSKLYHGNHGNRYRYIPNNVRFNHPTHTRSYSGYGGSHFWYRPLLMCSGNISSGSTGIGACRLQSTVPTNAITGSNGQEHSSAGDRNFSAAVSEKLKHLLGSRYNGQCKVMYAFSLRETLSHAYFV